MTQTSVDVPGGRLNGGRRGCRAADRARCTRASRTCASWDAMAPAASSTAGYRVIRYDARGFGVDRHRGRPVLEPGGRSSRSSTRSAIGRAGLVGNSRGGCIAFDTAIEYPGPGRGRRRRRRRPRRLRWRRDARGARALRRDGPTRGRSTRPTPEAIADFNVRFWVDGPGQPVGRAPAAIRDAVRTMVSPLFAPGHVDGQPIPLEPTASERVGELRAAGARGRRDPRLHRDRRDGPLPRGERARTRGRSSGTTWRT